jgi:2-dehydropantoate 2-reductase
VKVLADAACIASYQREGITVNGKAYAFDFVVSSSQVPRADLLLVAVKHPQLFEAIRLLTPVEGKDTIVLSLLNGISSEELIGQVIGREHLLYSYVYMDAVREGRAVRYSQLEKIVFGEAANEGLSARVAAVK